MNLVIVQHGHFTRSTAKSAERLRSPFFSVAKTAVMIAECIIPIEGKIALWNSPHSPESRSSPSPLENLTR
jgi:hypothetical protein